MMIRHRGQPAPQEVGIFIFFAWPILLMIWLVMLFFEFIGKLVDG
jgi:hypothetical protein